MKKRKFLKWMNSFVSAVLMVLLIGVATLFVYTKVSGGEPEVFGYQLKTVLSGSMEPEFQTGSIIAVQTVEDGSGFVEGDIITFMESQDKLVTHRIVEVNETNDGVIYTTKGDNNNAPDSSPVLAENVVAGYSGFTVPYAGYIINFAQTPNGALVFLVLPGVLMVGYSAISIWRALGELENEKKAASTDS
ncbi:signal peptidase I SipW [Virgibacillus kimchii]